jgi:membrane protein
MISFVQYILMAVIFILFTKMNLVCRFRPIIKIFNSRIWFFEWSVFTALASFRKVFDIYGGADALNYVNSFRYGFVYSSEFLFYGIGKIIRLFTDNYHLYFLFVYGVIVLAMLMFLANIFKDEKLSIPLLFLFFNMYISSFGIMRQWLAVSIGMIAIIFIKRKRQLLGFLVMIVAGCIHFSMLSITITLLVFYIYYFLIKHLRKNSLILFFLNNKLMIGIICNVVSCVGAVVFVNLISKTEYAVYVNRNLLLNVSWLGYTPIVFLLATILLFEKFFPKDEFSQMMIFLVFAHFSTIFIMVGLGMFRLFYCFFPIRIWGVYKLKGVLERKVLVSRKYVNLLGLIIELFIFLEAIVYMWRTIENGALPYFLDI